MSNTLESYVNRILQERKIQPTRISVFMAILQIWKEQEHQNPFRITRKKVMKKSGVKSIVTYHKCITELQDRGMMDYQPSYHPKLGSKVFLKNSISE